MDAARFVAGETWVGGGYELGIELGPVDDGRLRRALEALWTHQDLRGPWADRCHYPDEDKRLRPSALDCAQGQLLRVYGTVATGSGLELPCMVDVLRVRTDQMTLSIPTGGLFDATGIDFSEERIDGPTVRGLHRTLVDVARRVFVAVPFNCAVLGFEAMASADLANVSAAQVRAGDYLVSSARAKALGVSGPTLADGLQSFVRRL